MKIRFEFRRRSNPSDDVRELHNQLMNGLGALSQRWWNPNAPVPAPDLEDGLESQVNLGVALAEELNGYVAYVYRSPTYTGPTALYDDRLILDARVDQRGYAEFSRNAFPAIVAAFRPYRAEVVLDEDLALDDWEAALAQGRESGKDLDGRDGVYRIAPVSYWDEELCKLAFDSTPTRLEDALRNHVETASHVTGGLFVIATSAILDREQLVKLDRDLRAAMATSREVG